MYFNGQLESDFGMAETDALYFEWL